MDELNWFNDLYSDMVSLDFDSLFSTIDLKIFHILLLAKLVGKRTLCRTIQG